MFAVKEKIPESFHLPEWMCLRLFIFMKEIGTDAFCSRLEGGASERSAGEGGGRTHLAGLREVVGDAQGGGVAGMARSTEVLGDDRGWLSSRKGWKGGSCVEEKGREGIYWEEGEREQGDV